VANAGGWAGYFNGTGYFAGNVGVGTETPAEMLDVAGNLLVSGKATIGPGNTNTGTSAFVAGQDNTASNNYAAVGGGRNNVASGQYAETATVNGGMFNTASSSAATICGGDFNSASGPFAIVAGGTENSVSGGDANTIAGGIGNTISGEGAESFIGSGYYNEINTGLGSFIAGGLHNDINNAHRCFIGGGVSNTIHNLAEKSFIAGGEVNTISVSNSFIGAGASNSVSGQYSAVGGGRGNVISGQSATIGGGMSSIASGYRSAIGGGAYNKARGSYSVVSGGGGDVPADSNAAAGNYSTVPGGYRNIAGGDYSFAAGRRAQANHNGAFVWADQTDADFASTAADQFLIRASGGVGIGTTSPSYKLDVLGSVGIDIGSNFNDTPFTIDVPVNQAGLISRIAKDGNVINVVDSDGNVGLGTTNPSGKLHAATDGIYSGYFTSENLSGSTHIIHAEYTGVAGDGSPKAVYGRAVPSDGDGVGGYFEGGFRGVQGTVMPTGSEEYYTGVFGFVDGGSGDNYGVYGSASNGDSNKGVTGEAVSPGSQNIGVYGTASGATENWAGYFYGRGFFNDNVGIGTTSPDYKLDVLGSVGIDIGSNFNDTPLTIEVPANQAGLISRVSKGGNLINVVDSDGHVGIGTFSPQGALDVSSTTGAFIVPRMTTAERDALSAVNGMIVYNTTANQFNFYENGAWVTK
jgi:hypothetical protein